ncbi:MAG: Fe(3+) ABC transporter substrate-binding protein [Candidatus Muproteobacteria bacterium RBG_16_60_9]|uniref:Fe(3+) ABC transporter substrate-binding protein n=1 Tax=Candidatus Muproteobacteria bacterium RBG_16_60_9 TaxID=1817755 RepID=A0A1F6VHQ4_9PROT|nr:MAG: Fe(3+) ABC transporter substrate-binding protein [Candidatus Muproteobacteria bacterium RBG_16_60_9]
MRTRWFWMAAALASVFSAAMAAENEINVYSSRHYQSDDVLYDGFTKATGIKVNRIDAGEDALIERIRNEGARSPADVFITTDAGRLWRAEQLGLLQPVSSAILSARIPENFREPSGNWFGFSMRARVIAYNKAKVSPAEISSYGALADAKWKGRICVRSGTHIYNLSLLSAMIEHQGETKAEAWALAVKKNLAREPKGGDTDQIKGVAAGECDVAITNHYYYARLARSEKPADQAIAAKVGLIFPEQSGVGTHVNISGAAVPKHAPHRAGAIQFLEYLVSDEAQRYFAGGNNEWPVVVGAQAANPVLASFGNFKYDRVNVAVLGRQQPTAQKIYDRVGWR